MLRISWNTSALWRRLGGKTESPLQLRSDVQPVLLVGDASDQTPALVGPRASFGSGWLPAVGDFAGVQVQAGLRGARVFLDWQMTGAASASISWNFFGSVQTMGAGASAATAVPLELHNAALPLASRVVRGGFTAAQLATLGAAADTPQYLIRDAAVAAAGTFHVGGHEYRPHLFLAPGRVLVMFSRAATTFVYLSGYLEEPADAVTPA